MTFSRFKIICQSSWGYGYAQVSGIAIGLDVCVGGTAAIVRVHLFRLIFSQIKQTLIITNIQSCKHVTPYFMKTMQTGI